MSLTHALTYITDNVPNWIARLDDLTQQIICRHSELTQLSARQLKPKNGSTESLRPRTNVEGETPVLAAEPSTALVAGMRQQRQQVHAQMRRKRKPDTIASNAEPTKYRTRSMIIVYYDSAVQDAFEAIVREIGTARNNIRKGRMAARMKQMTSIPDEDFGADGGALKAKLAFTRSSRSRGGEGKTVYDTIDQALEVSQSLCEHGAHQFLRDGDCSTEISGIKSRLDEVTALAKVETEKLADAEKKEEEDRQEQERLKQLQREEKSSEETTLQKEDGTIETSPTDIIEVDTEVDPDYFAGS
ncbi:MAG: hypothetical protein M1816_001644 [Peltula sp. TS41687]|nr:MAG: hypothetical protein M1816_001644 [Peltula sp. TS41687]